MKVAIVGTFVSSDESMGRYVESLIAGLAADPRTPEVTLITAEHEPDAHAQHFHMRPAFRLDPSFPQAVLSQVHDLGPDIVHLQHDFRRYEAAWYLQTVEALAALGVPVVVTLHHPRADSPDRRAFLQRLSGLCTLLVHLPVAAAALRDIGGDDLARVTVIAHGTDGYGRPRQTPGSPFRLMQFGFLFPDKQPMLTLRALRLLLDAGVNVRLTLTTSLHPLRTPQEDARAAATKADCMMQIAGLGLTDVVDVVMDDFLPLPQLQQRIQDADLLVFPQRSHEFAASGALHRGLGAYVPVAAALAPKFFEEISRISPQLLFPADDAAALAAIAGRLAEEPAWYQHIASRTYAYARETAWPRVAAQHLDLYERLTGPRP